MITFRNGNLLASDAEALVNTVNTMGIMGKGIALMFKDAFPDNFRRYEAACKAGDVRLGRMFVTERKDLIGPRWIINFPTKSNWRFPSRIDWIREGLVDLKRVIVESNIRSIAVPPLGSGNGGLEWSKVRGEIVEALGALNDVTIIVFEPTSQYQNISKRAGVQKLTPARALISELVRRYSILGIDCTILEVQKLAYFLERNIAKSLPNPLDLQFQANRYGPYAPRLGHLLNSLDGSYLHCDKRIGDAAPLDVVRFDDSKKEKVAAYLTSPDAAIFRPALEATSDLIDGFESPLGMELLATVDWLMCRNNIDPNVAAMRQALRNWTAGGPGASERKLRLFDERLIDLALQRLGPDSDIIH